MKTLFIYLFSLGIPFLSIANPIEPLKELTSVRCKYKKVHVTFTAPMEKVYITFLNAEGEQVSRTKYKTKEAVSVPFNLSNLPVGDYQIKVETEHETETFNVTTFEKHEKKPLMAYGKFKDHNTINLLVVGLEKPGVTVEIFNEFNHKLSSEFIDEPEGFSKDYTFLNQNAGKIYFHVKDRQGRHKVVHPRAK